MLTVKFQNGEIVQNTAWLSLPPEPIQKIKYKFGDRTIIMEGYESYNCLVERVYAIIGNAPIIRNIYLMGVYQNIVKVIVLDPIHNQIHEYEAPYGKEYLSGFYGQFVNHEYNGRPSTGWHKGTFSLIPTYKIL